MHFQKIKKPVGEIKNITMKQLKITFLLALLMSMVGAKTFAYDAKIGGIFYYFWGTDAIVTYHGYDYKSNKNAYTGNVVIPETVTYNGTTYRVTGIGSEAFMWCSGLTSVTIPNSVTSIGLLAFNCCSGLTSVTIGNSVTSIGDDAFRTCSSLTDISVAPSNIIFDSRDNCNAIIKTATNELIVGCKNTVIPNSVTSIGERAFINCTGLTSITIPESVTSIGDYVFYECTGLTSINLSPNITKIGDFAFKGCNINDIKVVVTDLSSFCKNKVMEQIENKLQKPATLIDKEGKEIKDYNIPDGVTTIGSFAFSGCTGLTSVTIPPSVTSIGFFAFSGCTGLTSVTIPSSVTSIGYSAFSGCTGLTTLALDCENIGNLFAYSTKIQTLTLGEHVKSIGPDAFSGCTGLTSVTIPTNLISIDKTAFQNCTNIKLNAIRGTDGLLSVWNYGADPYEKGTSQLLLRPSMSLESTTQTSLTYQVNNVYPELEYQYDNNSTPLGNNEYLITGLRPELSQPIILVVKSANNSYSTTYNAETSPISPTLACEDVTASSLSVKGSYTEGDAKVVSCTLIMNGKEMGPEVGTLYGLDPNKSYTCKYRVVVEDANGNNYNYTGSKSFYTNRLNFATQQPRVISAGNVIVAADTNLNDEESNVGFEWRRVDWPDDFTSNSGGAYLYGGRMEGYIRNLNTDKLWRYRPYYESDTGRRYYGDWIGIDPTNTSYFEPTVYTYARFSVKDNTAEVRGYAMRGTEDVKKQGFMYWKKNSSSTRGNAKSIPANAMVVEAKGNVMIATLENLDYDTEYCYVAFATTANNETFYGEEQTFKTGTASQDVIDGIEGTEDEDGVTEIARYDLNGRKIANPQKGINIIRYSDGTSKKLLIK